MIKASAIRQGFLDYFAKAGHTVVRSSSLVPQNDPTLYFTNAGMVQFKDVFSGEESRDYRRAASSQKCLRVSGKHNDLETVGRTSRHHTFFEMLGNFSFGDYFKAEAIRLAWTFLTEEMGLSAERMIATVFGGDEDVPADEEAFALWRQAIGLPEQRILRLGKADNFWSMGDRGPCGPCTEVHYHQGDDFPCAEKTCLGVACECDRWVEIWNLVFMQFNRVSNAELLPLKQTGVDTGMGLERLAAVVQGVTSTYETDLLRPLIDTIASLAGKRYGERESDDISMRVIADHARATAFCIADGVFPEKGGREYVLRRIMRRAIRHGKLLGFEEPFFHQVTLRVVEQMGQAFPELVERQQVIEKLAEAEEAGFRRTLDRGLQRLHGAIDAARGRDAERLDDELVATLYDTHGFPVDLTRLIAEEAGLAVDEAAALKRVSELHTASTSKVGDAAVAAIYKSLADEHGPTTFSGYDCETRPSAIIALLLANDGGVTSVDAVEVGQTVEVICSETPFYGRAGGQVGDRGTIRAEDAEIAVDDTLKPGGALIVHQGRVKEGTLRVGQAVTLSIDQARRAAIRANHSATHLLHGALREILGAHVAQKGSEVGPKRLRFDFSHFEALSDEEVEQIEHWVNAQIRGNGLCRTETVPYDKARTLGAMALFGEKYGDRVRVVRVGDDSVELCGGTHVSRCGDIGVFRIVTEEPLALGVRRISAVTGATALEHDQAQQRTLVGAARLLRVGPGDLIERIDRMLAQAKKQDRELLRLKERLATGGAGTDLRQKVKEVNGVKLLATRVDAADPKTLRKAGDTLRDWIGSGVVVLGGEHEGKATLLVMVSKDLSDRFHAGKIVSKLAAMLDGRGGGRPDMAQAGGPRVDKLDEAIHEVSRLIEAG